MNKEHFQPASKEKATTKTLHEKESSIDMSNLSIFNPGTKKADKVRIKSLEDGSKVRVFKSSGKEIEK